MVSLIAVLSVLELVFGAGKSLYGGNRMALVATVFGVGLLVEVCMYAGVSALTVVQTELDGFLKVVLYIAVASDGLVLVLEGVLVFRTLFCGRRASASVETARAHGLDALANLGNPNLRNFVSRVGDAAEASQMSFMLPCLVFQVVIFASPVAAAYMRRAPPGTPAEGVNDLRIVEVAALFVLCIMGITLCFSSIYSSSVTESRMSGCLKLVWTKFLGPVLAFPTVALHLGGLIAMIGLPLYWASIRRSEHLVGLLLVAIPPLISLGLFQTKMYLKELCDQRDTNFDDTIDT